MIHAQGSNGLKIHYLGANHSLIQVKQPQKYLLLPVEETAPEDVYKRQQVGEPGVGRIRYKDLNGDGKILYNFALSYKT